MTQPAGVPTTAVAIEINGERRELDVDNRTSLLDALRERLALTGSKKGCDHGQCGACTVLVDGRRVLACLTLAVQADGAHVTTIEGLADGDRLHPMQTAFLERDAYQCGYCTPGQICSAIGMLDEARRGWPSHATEDVAAGAQPDPDDPESVAVVLDPDEVRERMSGNLCRCGAYANIVPAILDAADAMGNRR